MTTLQLVPAMEQGGVERGVVEVNRVLVRAGWRNVVVAAGGRLLEQIAADGGVCAPCDVKSKNPLTCFSRARALRKILVRERPDVVCAHSRVPAWLFRWANRGLGIPWITFAHGANSVSRYSRVMTLGDLTVTPSRYIADYLKAAYGLAEEKIRVIPRAIEAEKFDVAKLDAAFMAAKRAEWGLEGRYVVMGVGRITQLKGYDVLIDAVARLAADVPNAKLVLVGEAEEARRDVEENLRAQVAAAGLGDRVVFAGNQSKVAECLSLADVVVSANVRKPEAFGRSMAEALAMGKPVVACGFGGALDIVEDGVNGALVPPPAPDAPRAETVAAFATALLKVARTAFGDLRTPALEKFSFARMAESSLSVYREVAALRPAAGNRVRAGARLAVLAATVLAGAFFAQGETAFDAGADLRIREEVMDNVPGLPGAAGAMSRAKAGDGKNHVRFRPRVWGRLDLDDSFSLYARVADEMRWNVTPKHNRSYAWPDEAVLDNLWFEGRGLFEGLVDFRVGRQDLFDGRHSVFGLDRLVLDGAPYVGSRSCYADMIRTTFHVTDESSVDVFALYDKARNVFRVGSHRSLHRPMNAIHPGDSSDMDEWGGGVVWHSSFAKELPYKVYAIHKHNEAYDNPVYGRMGDKQLTTFGMEIEPKITDEWSLDLEGAKQVGRKDGGGQAGGWMGYGAVDFHPAAAAFKPFARLSAYYLSGDKDRTGADDGDAAWDPLWARAPCDSELMQYGTLYGLGYWSNTFHPKLTVGAGFGPHHAVSASSGPMYAAVQDGLGRADGEGASRFKGVLSTLRYDFPIVLAPKNATGVKRFEAFGHVLAEWFNPGDYFESDKPAWFFRWEVTFRF